MRAGRALLLAAGLVVGATCAPSSAQPAWEVCFTPGGDCTKAIVTALENAKSSVLVQAYTFTSAPIAKALLEASRRGVKVEAILDAINRRSARYSGADLLARAGIPVRIDVAHAIAHSKVIVIDGSTVITGSFPCNDGAAIDFLAPGILLNLVLPCHDAVRRARR